MNKIDLVKVAFDIIESYTKSFYLGPVGIVNYQDPLDNAITGTQFIDAIDDFDLVDYSEKEPHNASRVIEITDETTAVAGRRLISTGNDNAVILNFASAISPGGGFLHGAKAQEEDLCRVSTLHACLTREDIPYYKINKNCGNTLYTDCIIYSPKVPFIKDEYYNWLEQPFELSVVTCPAPNLNIFKGGELAKTKEIVEIFTRRVDRILSTMVVFEHRDLVLGAWGCGAFGNSPELVAKVFKTALDSEKFKYCFDRIIFAIPDRTSINYQTFIKIFNQ